MSVIKECCLLAIFLGALKFGQSARVLRERFNWRVLDFAYPTIEERLTAISNGQFIPENGLPVGIETWGDRMFVTVPRWREGNLIKYLVIIEHLQFRIITFVYMYTV